MLNNRNAAGVALVLVLVVASLSGCALLGDNPRRAAAAFADGAKAYCQNTGDLGREAIRREVGPELKAEHIELCAGCPGDTETTCTGEHRPKVDDPGEAS